METASFILAVIPPALAIVVEALNPINRSTIDVSADRDLPVALRETHLFVDTKSRAAILAAAAVEVSGLAPTMVASVTSGFAVIYGAPYPFWLAFAYVLIFVAGALFILHLLSGSSFVQIGIEIIRFRRSGLKVLVEAQPAGSSGLTREDVVKTTIYLANLLLICAAIVVFGLHL